MAEGTIVSTAAAHPLDPLSAEEISRAAGILREEKSLNERVRFAGVVLNEPPKESVLAFEKGEDFERQAEIVAVDANSGKSFEAVVSVTRGQVVSWEEIEGDIQPPIVLEEFDECEQACKDNPEYREAKPSAASARPAPINATETANITANAEHNNLDNDTSSPSIRFPTPSASPRGSPECVFGSPSRLETS